MAKRRVKGFSLKNEFRIKSENFAQMANWLEYVERCKDKETPFLSFEQYKIQRADKK